MDITVIIPYYNCYEYTEKLLDALTPQLKEGIEVILVDDGCHETRLEKYPIKVVHLEENSKTASVPRNVGLDLAQGKYICFIDADDMVRGDYIEEILKMCKEGWDYFYIGWTCEWGDTIIEDYPPIWNTACWNCVYKREIIGNERFDPNLRVGEDKDFVERVRKGKHSSIRKILYEYHTDVENSLTYGLK